MSFTTPLALILLIALPLTWYIGFPRFAYRRGRDVASLILRSVILLLLVLALAGAQIVRAADRLAVVFLVDASASVGANALPAMEDYIREAIQTMQPDDEAAVIMFGGDALVERPMNSVRDLAPLRSTPNTGNTDLEEAIGLGLALFPSGAAGRMVILSDGIPTVGDAEAAARRAAATGVEISYVPFTREAAPDIRVSDVRAPASVGAGEAFDLSLTVTADTATPATLSVFAAGAVIYREQVDLRAGDNTYALSLTAGAAGFRDFRVQVDPVGADGFNQNNQLAAFTRVVGAPRVLVLSMPDAEADAAYLASALEELGLTVDTAPPSALPIGVAALADYDAVVLNNVPATALSPQRMEALQSYVRDLGGGLIAVGGPDSYAPGGYFQTPLEETLPVEMQIRDQQRLPQLTIAYVIDRSGSMSAPSPSGVENLELAKEAIIRSIDFLQPSDRAGIVSFDTDGYWIAQPQPVFDRFALQGLVASLRAGGGTDILAGMRLAGEAMAQEPSPRKHIILLTDGGASERGLLELTRTLYEEFGVTTSTIAIGAGAAGFLDDMAQAGGGNYHVADDVATIPTIFAQETVLATRSYIMEETFTPALSALSPIMQGITAAPPLHGYVASTPKQTAQVILRGPEPFGDPILAAWQYGLGRAVAFTSDATARWAADWVAWDGFADFWAQAVRWTITEGTDANLETRVVMQGETARVIVDARDDEGAFLNGLALTGAVVMPDNSTQQVALQQVAPGRYEATFTPGAEGAYLLRVNGSGADDALYNQTSGWVMSYSPEFNLDGRESQLTEIAALTGGESLADEPEAVFAHDLTARAASSPIWQYLLIAALLLLPFDVAVRRLLVTRGDLARVRAALSPKPREVESSARMTSLRDAKARAQQQTTAPSDASAAPPSTPRAPDAPRPRPTRTASAPQASPPVKAPPAEDGTLAGRLLQKRKEREGEEK